MIDQETMRVILEVLLPAFVMCSGIYVLTRILNIREAAQREKVHQQREDDRRKKIDALYGRKK